MDFIVYSFAGAVVGFIVGVTGVGGGALMTPALMLFGFPAHIAIGTDLWFATLTKATGLVAHQRRQNINWSMVAALSCGSLPAAILTGAVLTLWFGSPESYSQLLQSALGIMLIITAAVLLLRKQIGDCHSRYQQGPAQPVKFSLTLMLIGAALGVLVTLSSVGAGAVVTAVLMLMFPYLLPKQVVGTDIAHAVPLTFIAGLIHLYLGHVDFQLLAALLVGSLPAIYFGAALAGRLSTGLLHPILACLLLIIGIRYAAF